MTTKPDVKKDFNYYFWLFILVIISVYIYIKERLPWRKR